MTALALACLLATTFSPAAPALASQGLSPISDCAALAQLRLGPNVTILSAAITDGASSSSSAGPTAAHRGGGSACTFEPGVDVGDPSTIVASFKGLEDKEACCAKCYAEPKCTVAAVLPAAWVARPH